MIQFLFKTNNLKNCAESVDSDKKKKPGEKSNYLLQSIHFFKKKVSEYCSKHVHIK